MNEDWIPTFSKQDAVALARTVISTVSESKTPFRISQLKDQPLPPALPDWAQKIKDFGFTESRPALYRDT